MLVTLDVRELQRVPMEIVVDDDLVLLEQALDKMRADEACAAGDTDSLSR